MDATTEQMESTMNNQTKRRQILATTLALTLLVAVITTDWSVLAQSRTSEATEKLDYAMLGKIREEGLNRSQVMDHISWLSDVYGPRLTGSPAIKQASEWTRKKFAEWGLANIHEEPFAF